MKERDERHSRDVPPVERWLPLLGLSLLVLGLYGRVLAYGYFRDDFWLLQPLHRFRFFRSDLYWRPLWHLWMAIQYHLFSMNPFPMHALSLLLHTLNASLAVVVMRRLGMPLRAAATAVAVWTVMAGNGYALTWISQSNDLLAMTFLLCASALWLSAFASGRASVWRALAASAMWLVSLQAKEVGLLWGPAIASVTVVHSVRSTPEAPYRTRHWVAVFSPFVFLLVFPHAFVSSSVSL